MLTTLVAVVLALMGFTAFLLFLAYFPVPQGHVVLIERFGQHQRVLRTGINFIIPGIDHARDFSDWNGIAYKDRIYLELAEQHTDTPPRIAMTKENVEVDIDASVYWQIVDVVHARYEVDRLPVALSDMALNVLRTAIGTLTLDQCLTERVRLNQHVHAHLAKACEKWGAKIIRVEIQTLKPSGAAGVSLLQEMSAERERRAAVLRATGEREAELLRASGDKDATVLRAQGEAQASLIRAASEIDRLKKLVEQLGPREGLRAALAFRYMDTLSTMSKDPALKVFLGYDGPVPLGEISEIALANGEKQTARPASWPPDAQPRPAAAAKP